MDSRQLTHEYGFTQWIEVGPYILCETGEIAGFSAPNAPVVYAMRLVKEGRPKAVVRLLGESDILRIGMSANFGTRTGQRLRNYKRNHQPPNRRTREGMRYVYSVMNCAVEVGWLETTSTQKARAQEAELIEEYYSKHKELPPWNRSG